MINHLTYHLISIIGGGGEEVMEVISRDTALAGGSGGF